MFYLEIPEKQIKIGKLTNSKLFDRINSTKKLDEAVEYLTVSINKAFDRSCPGRINRPKANHWWNNELQQLKNETRKLYRIARESKGSSNEHSCWITLRRSRNAYTREIRRAKIGDWVNFCSSIEGASAISRLHKLLAKDSSKGPGILKKPNGDFTNSGEEAAQLLLDTHFPGNAKADTCVNVNEQHAIEHIIMPNETIDKITTANRVEWALFSFDKYKSPGKDKIYPALIQKSWHIVNKCIVNIYKASLQLCYIPKTWQEVRVIFIPKPGKEDYTSPKSFRPISLTSVLLKGLERLIDRHIKEQMGSSFTIHESQHAIQKGKSTESALHALVSQIEETFDKKEFLVATFMDITGAFDNVSFEAINSHIEKCGLEQNVSEWIQFMLLNRNISLELYGKVVTVKATRGTPQGGVLSPTIWIIVMDSLLKNSIKMD